MNLLPHLYLITVWHEVLGILFVVDQSRPVQVLRKMRVEHNWLLDSSLWLGYLQCQLIPTGCLIYHELLHRAVLLEYGCLAIILLVHQVELIDIFVICKLTLGLDELLILYSVTVKLARLLTQTDLITCDLLVKHAQCLLVLSPSDYVCRLDLVKTVRSRRSARWTQDFRLGNSLRVRMRV